MIKQDHGEAALDELDKVYKEISIVCNVLSMSHL